jgi:hypothetical protein
MNTRRRSRIKRTMNKRNKRTKRRKYLKNKREKRITRSNKKLYGGMEGTVATKSDEVLDKLFEMINTGNFSFWFHSKSPITVENLYADGGVFKNMEIDETKKEREAANVVKFKKPSSDNYFLFTASKRLFRFWHTYGCVLSDETLYRLFKALFFHSIFDKYHSAGEIPILFADDNERDRYYDELLRSYPEIEKMGVLFMKLKHYSQDYGEELIDFPNLGHIFWIWFNYLAILINIIIINSFKLYDGMPKASIQYHAQDMLSQPAPMTERGRKDFGVGLNDLMKGMIPYLESYIDSELFVPYKQREYDTLNQILIHRMRFTIDPGRYKDVFSLDDLQRELTDGDPIKQLRVGETHGPYDPAAAREPEPAPAASEPEPAVQQGLTEDQKVAYDNLLQLDFPPDQTLKALESVNWDLDRALDVLLQ